MSNRYPARNDGQAWGQYGDPDFGYRPINIRFQSLNAEGTSLSQMNTIFPDEESCLRHVFDIRYGQGHPCLVCKRPAQWYKVPSRRYFNARCCRNVSISPTSGSLFDHTKLPLKDWFLLMLYFANSRTGVSATLAQRLLGTSHAAAFNMCDRIRTHMALLESRNKIGGAGEHVHVDEAQFRGILSEKSPNNRIIVLGMCTKSTLISTVIPNRKQSTIIPIIESFVKKDSIIVTDGHASYRSLPKYNWRTETVNHSKNIYVNSNGVSQAQIETYWGHMKRAFRLSHLRIERHNVWKYINAFNFVYNRRLRSRDTFWDMISCFPPFSLTPVPHSGMDAEFDKELLL